MNNSLSRNFAWLIRLLPIGIAMAALLLYLHTLAPGAVYFQDAGEFQTQLYTLELIHPTGYPYYQLLGKLWTLLLPIGTIAWRVNLFSAFCTALALVCLYYILAHLETPVWAILGACGALACSRVLWEHSILASVYALHVLLVAWASLALLKWQAGQWSPVWFALACGFGLAHHRVFFFNVPAFGLAILLDPSTRCQLWRKGWFMALIVVVVVGLSYLWLAYLGVWPLDKLFDFLFRQGSQFVSYAPSVMAWAQHLWWAIQLRIIPPYGVWPTFLALIGVLVQFAPQGTTHRPDVKRQAAILFLALGVVTFFSFSFVLVASDYYRYFLQVDLVLAAGLGLAGGAGARWLQRRLAQRFAWTVHLLGAMLTGALLVGLYQANVGSLDAWRDGYADRSSRAVLAAVESDATILSSWVFGWPLRYYQTVEGLRPDVDLLIGGEEYRALAIQQIESGAPFYFRDPMFGLDWDDSPYVWVEVAGAGLYRALPAPPPLVHIQSLEQTFSDGVVLHSLSSSIWPLQPDTFTRFVLDWHLPSSVPQVDLLLRLEDSGGRVRWEHRHPYRLSLPPDAQGHWQTAIDWIAPPTLTPGNYTLYVTLEGAGNVTLGAAPIAAVPVEFGLPLAQDRLVLENRLNPSPALPSTDPASYLLGYGFLEQELWIGRAAPLTLYWQVVRISDAPQAASLALETSSVHHSLQSDCPIPAAGAGALVESFCVLQVPKEIAPGRYRLTATVDATTVVLQEIDVRTRQHLYRVPAMQYKSMARLGDAITLLGYDIEPGVGQTGQDLSVTLYWRAESPPQAWLKVFVHLVGPDGALVGQHDGSPAEGWIPTSEWVAGEIVVDRHVIAIPADAPVGDGTIFVGMYSPDNGERLPAWDAEGTVYANHAIPLRHISIRRTTEP